MQDDLIRLYDGPSDNLLAVHDRVAIQGRVLTERVSYFPAAPKEYLFWATQPLSSLQDRSYSQQQEATIRKDRND